MDTLRKLLLVVSVIQNARPACIFPSVFKQSSWIDNRKGEIKFTTWEMKGWKFSVGSYNVSDWKVVDNTMFDSTSTSDEHGYLALRAHDTFTVNCTTYYSFVCLKFYKLSNNSYKYYQLHDYNTLAGGEKVKTHDSDALTRFDEICDPNFNYNEAEYNILIKNGMGSVPQSTCPNPILGRFEYTIDMLNGPKGCKGDDDVSDGCKGNTAIELNFPACPIPIAYSATGKLSCLDSTKYNDDNDYQIYVFNMDETVDNVNTFRISCIRVTEDGKEMSIAPRYCRPGQAPYNFPQENGANVGQKLTTIELSDCRNNPTQKDTGGLGIALGIGIGAGVVIAIIIIIIEYHFTLATFLTCFGY